MPDSSNARRAVEEFARHRIALFWAAGICTVLIGLWLRLDQFESQVLLDDEWHAVHQLVRFDPRQFMLSLGHSDYSIPLTLYDWLLAQTIGLSELGMRAPLLLAGVATAVAFPLALRDRFDDRVLLVFALALALSPLLVAYARTARPYALTLLLSYAALFMLDRATTGASMRWRPALVYALLAALSVWLHAITAPFVVAPLAALALSSLRGRGPSRPEWFALAMLTCAFVALALLPPLLSDPAAIGAKTGMDSIRWSTLRGVWHVWLGTSSVPVVVACVALAAAGVGPVMRRCRIARWAAVGLALTAAAVLIARPAWVFNPLTFGRYLLPALPLLLLCMAAGVVRIADAAARALERAVPHRLAAGRALRMPIALAIGTALASAWWLASPLPSLVREPNSNTLHYYHQFDYRPHRNPVVQSFATAPMSVFWRRLSGEPRGSVTVAVAPFRFESYDWLAPIWEQASGQRVIPGFLSGACVPWLYGEVPQQPRFAFRNAVHLVDTAALAAKRVGFVAYYRPALVTDDHGRRHAPECETWMRERFGAPAFEDEHLVVWAVPSSAGR